MKKTLYILRGLPGSGKTTLAKKLGDVYSEADMFFEDPETNEYKFDSSKLYEAHKWCQKKIRNFLFMGIDNVVVSNTFTTEKELQPYLDMAKEFDYYVVSLIVENRHGNTSIHNVPADTVEIMKNRFQIKL